MSSYQEWEEWKDSFLARRGLSKPDGRPLYKYRISIDEFESLKTLMTGSSLALRIKGKPDDDYNHYGFNGLFVLYASEYFRKEYSEIRWYFVHKSIGITLLVNPSPKLYACIESGLREWDRSPNQSISDAGGMKWLGSLILEGGLQLSMLADKGCHLGNFLNRFIKKTECRRPSAPDIAKWIEHSKDELQKTYQNKTFYDLLAELVWTVLHFKAVARITSPVDIIGQLDAYDQDWRDEFPLRIDDDQTRALIETLVKEAIKIPRVFQFPVVRELQKYGEDWQLKSSITLPDQLDISSLVSAFFGEDNTPPALTHQRMEICLDPGNQCCSLRRMPGHEAYRPSPNKPWELFGIDAAAEHVLRLNSDGQVRPASATKGEALDHDLPWVFEVDQDNFRFMRQGSGSIAAMEGIVVIPEDWDTDNALLQVGKIPSLDRTVYQFSGTVSIADGQGNNYQVRTGRTNAAEESYAMQGDRIWLGFLSPSLAYRGLPKLYTMDADCNIKPLGRPEWRALGSQTTTTAEPLGPVLATWLTDSGDVRYRAKMVILPLSAKISYELDNKTAKIRLRKWKAARAYTKAADIELRSAIKNDGDDLEITLKYCGAKYPPEYIGLEVEWDHSPIPVQLHLPLPLRGARAFDPMGRPIEQGANIAVQQLAGVRLLALNGSQGNHPHLELEFELGHIPPILVVQSTIEGLQSELKLQDVFRRDPPASFDRGQSGRISQGIPSCR